MLSSTEAAGVISGGFLLSDPKDKDNKMAGKKAVPENIEILRNLRVGEKRIAAGTVLEVGKDITAADASYLCGIGKARGAVAKKTRAEK